MEVHFISLSTSYEILVEHFWPNCLASMRGVHYKQFFLKKFVSTVHIDEHFCLQTSVADSARRTFHGVQDGINLLDDPWYRSLRRSTILSTLISAEHVNAIAHHLLHADHDLPLYTWWWRPYTAIPVTASYSTPRLALLVAYKSLTAWFLFQGRMLIRGTGVGERYRMPSFTPPLPVN